MKRVVLLVVLALASGGVLSLRAQLRVVPVDEQQGHVALGLALRHLDNTGIFMMATAHPDDENNGLLVKLNRGQGYRTTLATATRGNGGQNEIGPEIFEALGVLRTEELAAIHRFDGAEQYFTRAVDFGFSFSIDETFEKWGKDEIVSDYVRLIRMIRPDVVTGLAPGGPGGGQHHQASALIAQEAFKAAGDPTRYPDQIAAGLRPWQPRKFYFSPQFGPGQAAPSGSSRVTIDLAGYDTLLGRTYAEVGTEARSMHKCQGMAQLLSLPGPVTTSYELAEKAQDITGPDADLFSGVDTSLAGLAKFAGTNPPAQLAQGLSAIADAVGLARRRFDSESDQAAVEPLIAALRGVRSLRRQLPSLVADAGGRYEIDFRLEQKERELQDTLLIANGVRFEALANDGVVAPGQPIDVTMIVANRGAAGVEIKRIGVDGFDADAACAPTLVTAQAAFFRPAASVPAGPPVSALATGQVGRCVVSARVPASARVTEPYWHRAGESGRYTFDADAPFGLPYRPTPFLAEAALSVAGEEVSSRLPVRYRYEGDIFGGEKRSELLVVPSVSVQVAPEITIIPKGAARPRELRVTVLNDSKGPAAATVRLDIPARWTAQPVSADIQFTREDESQTVRFQLSPPPNAAAGEVHVRARVTASETTFDRGFQVIEYPHIRRQHIYEPAEAEVKLIDVKTAPKLTIGYVMGVGDAVPAAIEQLGADVRMLTADDLAWGDLSRFSAIVTGVRAYERRGDLRANNSRLLEYVRVGGTVIVQYNKFEFNQAQYGPYAAKVSNDRVTDEFAPVRVLAPTDPIFTTPNQIGESAWRNWVQERGLYFLGERDPRYRDLVALEEPFPYNKGEKRGALVSADYGKGRWIYVGLGLWRELPAGVDGAYQLLANLISLGGR